METGEAQTHATGLFGVGGICPFTRRSRKRKFRLFSPNRNFFGGKRDDFAVAPDNDRLPEAFVDRHCTTNATYESFVDRFTLCERAADSILIGHFTHDSPRL